MDEKGIAVLQEYQDGMIEGVKLAENRSRKLYEENMELRKEIDELKRRLEK